MGRAFIALALHLRYGGRVDDPVAFAAHALLTEQEVADSALLGLALRLAYTLCGGALSLLDAASLTRDRDRVILRIAPEFADLLVDVVERRLEAVAKLLGLSAEIMIAPLPAPIRDAMTR
jgi:exopolyphosphatase/guanosine-5'-triphosphate,3'-diphosphate pyrophosphatase